MAYCLDRDEPLSFGIRRVAREELTWAIDHLAGRKKTSRDVAIHETRKSIKKTRAVLRLVRVHLGDTWEAENNRLRKVARTLAEFRDAAVMMETFDQIKREFADKEWPQTLSSVRAAFGRQRVQSARDGGIRLVLKGARPILEKAMSDIEAWPLATDDFSLIEAGIGKAYRRSRNYLEHAQSSVFPEVWHEFRKRVKDHWYQMRLLENSDPERMAGYEKRLKQLETALGDDHNLVVLHDKIRANPAAYGKDEDIEFLVDCIGKYQKRLRRDARDLSVRIYDEKPRKFVSRIREMWEESHPQQGPQPVPVEPVSGQNEAA
jgi:CHAD domain-containing protein